jgi:hypothetical protein
MARLPLSASDIHAIADTLEKIELLPGIVDNPVIGRIEVIRPDGDDLIGYFVREGDVNEDPWFGLEIPSPFGTFHA